MKYYEVNDKNKFGFSAIYLWTNQVNGKLYVGQTQNFYVRIKQYVRGNDSDRVIGRAFAKYGIDNFTVDILERDIPIEKLDEREQYWMDYYKSYERNIGYNVCREAGTTRGFHHSEESREAMSKHRKEYFEAHPDAIKRGKDNPMYGRKMSEERKESLRHRNLGNQYAKGARWDMSEETKQKISAALKGNQNCLGRKLSQETKDKIAESNRRRVYSEETKAKISEANKGKSMKRIMCIETGVVYDGIVKAVELTGISYSAISHCCRGCQKTAGGYHWKYYVDEETSC